VKVTASTQSNSTIVVTWKIGYIHPRLEACNLRIKYCEMKREKPEELDESCNPCRYNNITAKTDGYTNLTGLRSYTRYRIKAQAINIVAKDGTEVKTPYGQYSNPSDNKTVVGGEE